MANTTITPIPDVTRVDEKASEVQAVAASLEPFLWDVPRTVSIMALLALAAVMMCPDLEQEEIQESITGMSEWLCLYICSRSPQEGEEIRKELMN